MSEEHELYNLIEFLVKSRFTMLFLTLFQSLGHYLVTQLNYACDNTTPYMRHANSVNVLNFGKFHTKIITA